MVAVTILAGGGPRGPHRQARAVDAGFVDRRLVGVAKPTAHRLGGDIVIGMLGGDVRVATAAGIGLIVTLTLPVFVQPVAVMVSTSV